MMDHKIQGIQHLSLYPKYLECGCNPPPVNLTTVSALVQKYSETVCGGTIYIPQDVKVTIAQVFMNIYFTNIMWTSSMYKLIREETYFNNSFRITIPTTESKAFMVLGNYPLQTLMELFKQNKFFSFGFNINNHHYENDYPVDPGETVGSVSYGIMLIKNDFDMKNMSEVLKTKKLYNKTFMDELKNKYNIDTMVLDYNKAKATLYYGAQSHDLLYQLEEYDVMTKYEALNQDDDLWCNLYYLDKNNIGVFYRRGDWIFEREYDSEKKIIEKIKVKNVTRVLFFIYVTETDVCFDQKPTDIKAGVFSVPNITQVQVTKWQQAYSEKKLAKKNNAKGKPGVKTGKTGIKKGKH